MKYPVISPEELERLATERMDGRDVDAENSIKWVGQDPEIDLTMLRSTSDRIRRELEVFREGPDVSKLDLFEGRAAGWLHEALSAVPLCVLDDPGFWRYVGAAHLWELVRWRQETTYEKGWSSFHKYVDGTNRTECIALRMFVRGRIAEVDGDYSLSTAVERGTDLWRSHIVRVDIGYSAVLSRELVRQVAEYQISTDPLRQLAKDITRYRSNVLLPLYDETQATGLLDELRTARPEAGSSS